MKFIVLDFETYYDRDYSLSSKQMTTESYVRDPRFESYGCAIWISDMWASPQWFPHAQLLGERDKDIGGLFRSIDWARYCVVCHHAHFDGLILAHHYHVRPGAWACTLAMSRLCLGQHVKHSLDSIRQRMGLPPKLSPYEERRGKHWAELDEPMRHRIAMGAIDEVQSIWIIFNKFLRGDY